MVPKKIQNFEFKVAHLFNTLVRKYSHFHPPSLKPRHSYPLQESDYRFSISNPKDEEDKDSNHNSEEEGESDEGVEIDDGSNPLISEHFMDLDEFDSQYDLMKGLEPLEMLGDIRWLKEQLEGPLSEFQRKTLSGSLKERQEMLKRVLMLRHFEGVLRMQREFDIP